MALCIPIHLRQRTSRVYQDFQHLCRVLTSFVPPVHNQGVNLAPLQGLALWKIIPADYWLILCIKSYCPTDLFCMLLRLAPYGGRFPCLLHISSSLPVTAGFSSQQSPLKAQSNRDRTFFCVPSVSMLPVSAAS